MDKTKLQWHPAFGAALRITLQDEMKYLEMHEEYLLGKKPLQMDILLIKKAKEIPIQKSIGRIFRKHNIIGYKSPVDYLSINDFYKVYAYACLYQSDTDKINEIDPETLTITFVCSRFPQKLCQHLTEVRGIAVENIGGGIYYLKGDPFPIQLLITPELSGEENYWIQNLRTDLKAGSEIRSLVARYENHKHSKDYEAVMDLITRANWEEMEVERKMCDALKELLSEELHAENTRGKSEGISLAKQVFKLSAQGFQPTTIAEKCNISLEQVNKILE